MERTRTNSCSTRQQRRKRRRCSCLARLSLLVLTTTITTTTRPLCLALSARCAIRRSRAATTRRGVTVLHESSLVLLDHPSPPQSTTTCRRDEEKDNDQDVGSNNNRAINNDLNDNRLPPWLKRLERYTTRADEQQQQQHAMIHLDWLEYALLEAHFSFDDVRDILHAVEVTTTTTTTSGSSNGDVVDLPRLVGTIDFLRLILQLTDEEQHEDMFCTKDVLLASILHYSDCITVRETGVYEMVQRAVHGRESMEEGNGGRQVHRAALPSSDATRTHAANSDSSLRDDPEVETYNDITRSLIAATRRQEMYSEAYAEYGEDVTRIARDAARVKRAEILAHAVLDVGRKPSKEEASRLRGLLLSVMDDWRALAIRAVACLYRLEGTLQESEHYDEAEYVELSPEVVKTTREALHVYAPLAQRLGMQRLKARLEDRAFRIMYRRQYDVVSSLYKENGAEMALISSDLSSRVEMVLRQAPSLMDQLEDLRVTSRVKEPYSLWKKLLKLRQRRRKASTASLTAASSPSSTDDSLVGSTESLPSTSSDLSLFDVKDGIAVRVVLKAKKWTPDEPDEITRARERLLCYYVQQVLGNYWPIVGKGRVKDYIRFPKANGYQSLHYTSSITYDGNTWPFEVQVRSEEMHSIAEYGVASHWDYKLKGNQRTIELLSPSSTAEQVSSEDRADMIPVDSVLGDQEEAAKDPYIDALVTSRNTLVQQKVFVFFAGSSAIDDVGQLLSLPVGATVGDAISELKEQVGLDINVEIDNGSVLRNGRTAKADEYIGNGDVILITLL